MNESNTFYVTDEEGRERKMTILFTFDDPETKKQYVLYQDPEADPENVFASCYDEEGNLYPVESDREWEMIEEVFNAFVEEEDDEQK